MDRSSFQLAALLASPGLLLLAASAPAQAQIKQPGAHPDYSVELEPHVLAMFDGQRTSDEGFGLGLRASIPVMHNGPVPKINNNLAIGFGLDWGHFSESCWGWWGRRGPRPNDWGDCSEDDFVLPAVAQWNFFFTPVVSAYTEFGLAFTYSTVHWECPDGFCQNEDSDLDLDPMFAVGGRFLFGETAGLIVRLGWPYVSIGASILL
jgi:hypothetical protein